jgi:hypothetical protein
MHPYFKSARADGRHGFEVGRVEATLHLPQFKTRGTPGLHGEISQVVQTIANEFQLLH